MLGGCGCPGVVLLERVKIAPNAALLNSYNKRCQGNPTQSCIPPLLEYFLKFLDLNEKPRCCT